MNLSRPLPLLLVLAATLPAADQPAAAPTVEDKLKALEQQVKLLIRKNEIAEEVAKAADDKAKALVKESDLTFKWKATLQGRATAGADATDKRGSGQDYFAPNSANGSESEPLRFGLRRTRLVLEARSKNDWYGQVTLRADSVGLSGTASTGGSQVGLYQSIIGKTFTVGDYQHDVKIGLDQFYSGWSAISASTGLFSGDRATGVITGASSNREVGVAYQFRAPFLKASFDVQDGSNLARNAVEPSPVGNNANSNTGNYDRRPTPFTSLRIEGSPGSEFQPSKKQESYIGAYGTEVVFGLDYHHSGRSYAVSNEERQVHTFGPDVLVHWDNLTFLAEYRFTHLGRSSTNEAFANDEIASLNGRHWTAQAGYVLPLDDFPVKIEPALRLSVTDWATDIDEQSQWGANGSRDNNAPNPLSLLAQGNLTKGAVAGGTTNLGSGNQIDLGVNLYWNGHANKTQISFQSWKAEAGEAKASAFIVAQQVTF